MKMRLNNFFRLVHKELQADAAFDEIRLGSTNTGPSIHVVHLTIIRTDASRTRRIGPGCQDLRTLG